MPIDSRMRMAYLFLCLPPLASCQEEAAVPTEQENAQLDDAANLLNGAQENLEAVDDGGLGSVNETL
jgi:hypothetical protein